MKEVIIINLTRMGDLVQTTPVMTGLKEACPDVRITLLVNSDFSEVCEYIPHVDRLIVFDKSGFQKEGGGKKPDLVDNYRYLEGLLNEINGVEYDLLINFTHSTASAVLTSMIRAREVRGFSVDAEGHGLIKHPWIRYFFNIVPGRGYNPFHLCDIYVKAGGVIPSDKGLHLQAPEDAMERVESVLGEKGIKDDDLLIGLQLGASQDNRRWPVSSFAQLADRLARAFGARVCLIGAGSEARLGEEFEGIAATEPVNLIGKTDLRDLTALLKRCDLIISNDTGPLHIATAVGTRVVGIFLATAHFRETGPYGEGHYVVEADIPCSPCGFQVECSDMVCKRAIGVDNIFDLARLILSEGSVFGIEDSRLWRDLQVYRSYFADDGLLDYSPVIKRPPSKETLLLHLYRVTWPRILDRNEDVEIEEACRNLANMRDSWYCEDNITGAVESLRDEIDAFTRLRELAEEGIQKVSGIAEEAGRPSIDVERVKGLWEGTPDIDRRIVDLGYAHPPLHPLTLLFKYGKESLEGDDLIPLSEKTCDLYMDIKNHASMMINLIEGLISSKGECKTVADGMGREVLHGKV